MKYTFLAACGAVTLASAMTLSAQTPAQPPATRPQTPAPTQPATRTDQSPVTVTGCLKPWDNAMGAGGADPMAKPGDHMAKPGDPMAKPGAPMASTRWVLTNVQGDKAMGQSPSQSPSAGAASPAHPQASQYVVMAGTGVNLSAHVNHQVRITGTVAAGMDHGNMAHADKPGDKPMARPGDAKPAPGMADRMGDDKKPATLTATSVTMISATCTTTVQQ